MLLHWILGLLLLLIPFSRGYPDLRSRLPAPIVSQLICPATIGHVLTQQDFAAKIKGASTICPAVGTVSLSNSDDYSCSESTPCSNGACCAKSGWCGFGPDYCGKDTKHSPNNVCWSNCDAEAECGRYADDNKECPLKICCSQYGFCGTSKGFCTVTKDPKTSCQSNCDQPKSGGSEGDVQKRIIGYYEAWNYNKTCMGMKISDIPIRSLTHLYFAFGYISPDTFDIVPMGKLSHDIFRDVAGVKKDNPDLKVLIALGGWGFNDNHTVTQPVFHDLVTKSANRKKFISNLLAFLRNYGYDGVDFDWEYPGATDRDGNKYDGENFALLLKELQRAILDDPEEYLVSFTAPTSYWYLRHFTRLEKYMDYVDWVNVMTYDLHGVWDRDNPIGSHVLAHTNLTEIKAALDLFWRNDIDPKKVNLGLGFYGRSFQLADPSCNTPGCLFKGGGAPGECTESSGTLSYREVMDIIDKQQLEPYHDTHNAVKYVHWNDQWVSFDDIDTFQEKITFANSIGLGGLFIWALDHDTPDLDALQGVLHPKALGSYGAEAAATDHWRNAPGGNCRVADCGVYGCNPGEIIIGTAACGDVNFWTQSVDDSRAICCPLSNAPNPSDCVWRGGGKACNGQCHAGEMTLYSSRWADDGSDPCWWGVKVFCCPVANKPDCRWTSCNEECSDEEETMTWSRGPCAYNKGQNLCCNKEQNWSNCNWQGQPGKCDDNRCAQGQVAVEVADFAKDKDCGFFNREMTYCCDPPSDEEAFLPVPLDYLFPDPPPVDEADSDFTLKLDSTASEDAVYDDNPDNGAFGFVVLTSPEEVQTTLDKRDGSHWELLDCFNAGETEHTVRMTCTDDSLESNCHKIYLGRGVPGTILEMPGGCGPGRYAVAKSMDISANQSLPHHLKKRGVESPVYDLTFDYNFRRVPRDLGKTQIRVDYSNEPGYWDGVVDKAATHKRKRNLEKHRNNHKRWLEEAWRDDMHGGHLAPNELHKRWFGSDVVDWLKGLVNGGFSGTVNFKYGYSEDFVVKLIEEKYGPCDIHGVEVSASLDVKAEAHVDIDTAYGFTLIATLDFPPDLSNSYLYFRNRGEASAKFTVDALVTASFKSGDIEFLAADKFGAAFTVPGILTVGPNFKLLGSVEGEVSVSGNLEARVKLADWDVRQTYPVASDDWSPEAEKPPNRAGTQPVGTPEISYEVKADGHITGHIKPVVSFGIDFKKTFIDVPSCKVDLVGDGHLTFHAWASTGSDGSEFCYEAVAGAELYAALDAPSAFSWVLPKQNRFDIARTDPINVIEETCPFKTDSPPLTRKGIRKSALLEPSLKKRARVYGPPDIFRFKQLKCPGQGDVLDEYPCTCLDDDDEGLIKRQGASCPLVPGRPDETWCSDNNGLLERGKLVPRTGKHISWKVNGIAYDLLFRDYPSCSEAASGGQAARWFGFEPSVKSSPQCHQELKKFTKNDIKTKDYQADHIYEAQTLAIFFKWLTGETSLSFPHRTYTRRATVDWVLGTLMGTEGFSAPFMVDHSTLNYRDPVWYLATFELGAYKRTTNRIALLQGDVNRQKGVWFGLNSPDITVDPLREAKLWQRNAAGVFQYLKQDTVYRLWRETSYGVEQALADFDEQYPWDNNDLNQPKLPARQPNQPRAGLRDLYCFFIDVYLHDIEQRAANWANAAKATMESDTQAAAEKKAWIKGAMTSGIVTPSQMQFLKPGSAWSVTSPREVTGSTYGMWQLGNAGPFV